MKIYWNCLMWKCLIFKIYVNLLFFEDKIQVKVLKITKSTCRGFLVVCANRQYFSSIPNGNLSAAINKSNLPHTNQSYLYSPPDLTVTGAAAPGTRGRGPGAACAAWSCRAAPRCSRSSSTSSGTADPGTHRNTSHVCCHIYKSWTDFVTILTWNQSLKESQPKVSMTSLRWR